jgi:hypothetical protein
MTHLGEDGGSLTGDDKFEGVLTSVSQLLPSR